MPTHGYRLTFFRQEQAGSLKQYELGPILKLRGPEFRGKLNLFQHHCQSFALLIGLLKSDTPKICIAQIINIIWNQLNEDV